MWTDFSIESTAYPKLPAYGLGVKDTIFSSKNGMQCGRASHGSRDLLEAVISSGTVRKWKYIFFLYFIYTFFKSHILSQSFTFQIYNCSQPFDNVKMRHWFMIYICLAVLFFKELNSTSVCTWRLIPGVLLQNAISMLSHQYQCA